MPVQSVRRGISVARNGVGAFVLPCRKLTFRFCNWGASSVGIREFLHESLNKFSKENPGIEFEVIKKHGHPVIIGDYLNGKQKVICVRNLTASEVAVKANLLRDASGRKLARAKNPVSSINDGPRGIWSPFHVLEQYRHKV
ncbi:mitochondrial 54S ribosomal protein mL43 [Kockiozyma suomiensis]|uniref:mitochondrial 54S ribosomal protein mL43 n=1 Tax=Kockiozyma suomiensis TaxID=1337062 RepID=UPI003343A7AE